MEREREKDGKTEMERKHTGREKNEAKPEVRSVTPELWECGEMERNTYREEVKYRLRYWRE